MKGEKKEAELDMEDEEEVPMAEEDEVEVMEAEEILTVAAEEAVVMTAEEDEAEDTVETGTATAAELADQSQSKKDKN